MQVQRREARQAGGQAPASPRSKQAARPRPAPSAPGAYRADLRLAGAVEACAQGRQRGQHRHVGVALDGVEGAHARHGLQHARTAGWRSRVRRRRTARRRRWSAKAAETEAAEAAEAAAVERWSAPGARRRTGAAGRPGRRRRSCPEGAVGIGGGQWRRAVGRAARHQHCPASQRQQACSAAPHAAAQQWQRQRRRTSSECSVMSLRAYSSTAAALPCGVARRRGSGGLSGRRGKSSGSRADSLRLRPQPGGSGSSSAEQATHPRQLLGAVQRQHVLNGHVGGIHQQRVAHLRRWVGAGGRRGLVAGGCAQPGPAGMQR